MVIEALLIILPGLLGNVASWLSGKLKVFECPLDFNIKINGKRLLGKNKTFRGLFASTAASAMINSLLGGSFYIGCLMGFSTSIGDAIKSLFKRRLNIKDGKDWYPFDLMDVPIGYSLFVFPILNVNFNIIILSYIFAILITFVAHFTWKYLNFKK